MFFQMIYLPPRDEMFHRLVGVNASTSLQRKFYPLLMREAGQPLMTIDIVRLMQIAMYEYARNASSSDFALTIILAPRFIDAITPDRAVAQKAKEIFSTMM